MVNYLSHTHSFDFIVFSIDYVFVFFFPLSLLHLIFFLCHSTCLVSFRMPVECRAVFLSCFVNQSIHRFPYDLTRPLSRSEISLVTFLPLHGSPWFFRCCCCCSFRPLRQFTHNMFPFFTSIRFPFFFHSSVHQLASLRNVQLIWINDFDYPSKRGYHRMVAQYLFCCCFIFIVLRWYFRFMILIRFMHSETGRCSCIMNNFLLIWKIIHSHMTAYRHEAIFFFFLHFQFIFVYSLFPVTNNSFNSQTHHLMNKRNGGSTNLVHECKQLHMLYIWHSAWYKNRMQSFNETEIEKQHERCPTFISFSQHVKR